MTKSIFRSILLVALAVLLVALIAIFGITYTYYGEQLQTELKQEGIYVAAGIENGGYSYLEKLSDNTMRLTWVAADGSILYDNKANPADMENHSTREEIMEAVSTGEGYATRRSDTLSKKTVYYATLLQDGTVLRVSSAQYSLWIVVISMLQPILIVFVITLACAGFIAVRLSRNIVGHVHDINLKSVTDTPVYPELQPIADHIKKQNRKIIAQMEELRARQTEFNTISGNMSEGIIIINRQADILSCNRGALRVFACEGNTPKSVLALDTSPEFREAVRLALDGKNGYDSKKVDGRSYMIMATPVVHDDVTDGALIFIRDETEKEERDALRREFTSNVSHELKTPLTSISGFAELLKNGMTDADETKHFGENIYREAQRLIRLVEDIIRLSQLDGGEIPFDDEEIDLYELSCEVVSRLENVAAASGVTMTTVGEPGICVCGNRRILEEVIYNLCDNSIKYNREGGKSEVRIERAGTHPTLTVSDTGIGIPHAEQARVFERFYRVDKSHSKKIGGTGLGLSIVKHGANYLGATISLTSEVGQGTSITLSF